MPTKAKVTPDVDLPEYNSFTFQGEEYHVKRKFKVGRFLKNLNNDPDAAIEIALEDESYERYLDLEMTMQDLEELLELLANTLSGTNAKN